MKKLMLMAAIAVFGLSNLSAQEEATTTGGFSSGDVYITGSAGFNTSKQGDFDTSNFNIAPGAGFFVSDNIAIEATLYFASSKSDNEDKNRQFGGQLGARYFFTSEKQFSFTAGINGAYLKNKFDPDGGDSTDSNLIRIAIEPGINYFVSDHFALRATVGALSYNTSKVDQEGAEARNDIGLNLNLANINFGLTYKF